MRASISRQDLHSCISSPRLRTIVAVERIIESIRSPDQVWSRDDVRDQSCPVPKEPGIYGWYFRNIPPSVPVRGCERFGRLTLLYVGISPRGPESSGTLRARIKTHYRSRGASTLRRDLGVLLEDSLHLQLRSLARNRFDYGQTEESLSEWMSSNAYVVWAEHLKPWVVEPDIIATLNLPLNIDHNVQHPFSAQLKALRADASKRARSLAI